MKTNPSPKKFPGIAILAMALISSTSHGATVSLQNATSNVGTVTTNATTSFNAGAAIDGTTTGSNGWHTSGGQTSATFVVETMTNLDDQVLTFTMIQNFEAGSASNNPFSFQKLRFSYTTADRSTFANGATNGGDVTADWTVLTPALASIDSGETATINLDNSVDFAKVLGGVQYTVTATAGGVGITGFRIEALAGAGDVAGNANLVGWSPNGGGAILSEFKVDAVAIPEPSTMLLGALAGLVLIRRKR